MLVKPSGIDPCSSTKTSQTSLSALQAYKTNYIYHVSLTQTRIKALKSELHAAKLCFHHRSACRNSSKNLPWSSFLDRKAKYKPSASSSSLRQPLVSMSLMAVTLHNSRAKRRQNRNRAQMIRKSPIYLLFTDIRLMLTSLACPQLVAHCQK